MPADGNEWWPVGDGLFGWVGDAAQAVTRWVRDWFSDYEPYERGVELAAQSDQTATDIRLFAVLAVGAMILAVIALVAVVGLLVGQRIRHCCIPPPAAGVPVADGVQVQPSPEPVAYVGYAPGHPAGPGNQPLAPIS